jgi:hypothetical protein
MIERILPDRVATAEAFGDDPAAELFPQEFAAVARATESRRLEFATGRACTRVALARLGQPAVAVPRGPRGDPQWPEGVDEERARLGELAAWRRPSCTDGGWSIRDCW